MTELILSIFKANGRLLRRGDELTKDLGITALRWQVLSSLQGQPLRTVAQLARRFESTRQSVLWTVTALVDDGLVELVHNPDHRRAKLVKITEKGLVVIEKMAGRQIAWVNEMAVGFDAAKISAAASLVDRMLRDVEPT